MNNRPGWRGGFGFAQIMATLLVVLPVIVFMMTILFDYWAIMRLDNQLKLIAYRCATAVNNAQDLSSDTALKTIMQSDGEWARVQGLCPPSRPNLTLTRQGDLAKGQSLVSASLTYERLNHRGPQVLTSTLQSYSYRDQNGSFLFECKI